LEDEDLELLDDLLLATVCDAGAAEPLIVLAGVGAILVVGLGDLERCSVLLLASLYDAISAVIVAVDSNPFDTAGVSEEDLISIDLDLLAAIANDGAFAEVTTGFAEMESTLIVGTSDVEDIAALLPTTLDGALGNVGPLGQNPGSGALWAMGVESGGALLCIIEPVRYSPGLGFVLLLALLVMLESGETSTQQRSTGQETATDLELLLPLIVEIVPVGLLLVLGGLDGGGRGSWVGDASTTVAVLRLLGLLRLLLLGLLVVLAAVTSTALVLLAVVATMVTLRATPECGGYIRSPVALTPVWLDDFVLRAAVLDDAAVIVLCTWFPALDHDVL